MMDPRPESVENRPTVTREITRRTTNSYGEIIRTEEVVVFLTKFSIETGQ